MSTNVPLTKCQMQVFEFIKDFIGQYGYFPRYEDIARGVGLSSKSNVARYIRVLEAKGVIVPDPPCPRARRLVTDVD